MAGFVWAVVLIVAAFLAPAYRGVSHSEGVSGSTSTSGTSTLVEQNGLEVLAPTALPALLTLLIWFALYRTCSRRSPIANRVAWMALGLLGAFCVLAMFSVGVFVMPVFLLLAGATALAPRR